MGGVEFAKKTENNCFVVVIPYHEVLREHNLKVFFFFIIMKCMRVRHRKKKTRYENN